MLVTLFGGLALLSPGASAEPPSLVVERSAADGVYVSPARFMFDEATFTPIVDEARNQGLVLVIAVPFEAPPNTNAFARRVREAADVDAAIVFGPDDIIAGDASEDYEDNLVRAINSARAAATPEAAASSFVTELVTEPVRERPAFLFTVRRWVVVLVLIVVIASVLEFVLRRGYREVRKRRHFARQA